MNSIVDLSSSRTVQLPEGKPPFSYGFPMVFLWFSYGFPMENGGSFHCFLFVYQAGHPSFFYPSHPYGTAFCSKLTLEAAQASVDAHKT